MSDEPNQKDEPNQQDEAPGREAPEVREAREAPEAREVGDAAGTRPASFVVLAVLNFGVAALTLLWIAALFGFGIAGSTGSGAPGVATVWAMALMSCVNVVLLVVGGVGLLRCARWGWMASVGYGVLATGAAFILLATGAGALFVFANLLYPVVLLLHLTTQDARRTVGL
ncbi:MAG: hypothetical protein ABI333_18315 [bacterium]